METPLLPNFILRDDTQIKIIGDSIAAGRGSSDCTFDGEYIIKTDGRKYYRQTGKKYWGGVLETALKERYPHLEVINNSCNSLNTHQIHKFIDTLADPDDDLIFLMMGTNDRKLPGGMHLLNHDLRHVINRIREMDIPLVLLVPGPSTPANEYRGDKIYHMSDVNTCVKSIGAIKGVPVISFYDLFLEYIRRHHITIEQFMEPAEELDEYGLPAAEASYSIQNWNRLPDGLHPPDSVQAMMAQTILKYMGWNDPQNDR